MQTYSFNKEKGGNMKIITRYIVPVLIAACFIIYSGKQELYTREKSPVLTPVKFKQIKNKRNPAPAHAPADTLRKADTLKMQSEHPKMDYKMFKKTLYLHRNTYIA